MNQTFKLVQNIAIYISQIRQLIKIISGNNDNHSEALLNTDKQLGSKTAAFSANQQTMPLISSPRL